MLPFAVSLLLVTLSPYFHFFLFSSSPHPFMPPYSLPLLTYSSFNQLPCSSPAVLCSFCCSSQWIFDAVKCVTGWETLAPPRTFSLSLPVSPPIIFCLPVSLSHSTAESASVQWSELALSHLIHPSPTVSSCLASFFPHYPPLFNQPIVSYIYWALIKEELLQAFIQAETSVF